MPYTPPAGNTVDFDFTGTYTAPTGNVVVFDFGGGGGGGGGSGSFFPRIIMYGLPVLMTLAARASDIFGIRTI